MGFFSLTLLLPDIITDHFSFALQKDFAAYIVYYVECCCSRAQETICGTKHWFNVLIPIEFIVNFFLQSVHDLLHLIYALQ